ncbi:MAG: hypothetical protein H7A23_14125 [Leptospiraceae bacterium]|nr:hypothetical protein [Leptospiraceae bacterium]
MYGEDSVYPFMGNSLLQLPTTEDIGKKNLDFRFSHRFGDASTGIKDFFGLDKGANILLVLDYGLTQKWSAGISRASEGRTYEIRNKYKLFNQSLSFPFSISLWGVVGQRTSEEVYSYGPYIIPNITTTQTNLQPLADVLNREYQTKLNQYTLSGSDKRSFMGAILISRKFTERFSLQVSPIFVHRNFVKYGLGNDRTGLDIGGRIKFSKRIDFTFEVIFTPHRDYIGQDRRILDQQDYGGFQNLTTQEINSQYNQPQNLPYVYARNVLYDKPVPYSYIPFSIGLDIETGGHVFQLIVSNSTALAQTTLLNGANYNYANHQFVLGFNIHRSFSFQSEPKFDDWKK